MGNNTTPNSPYSAGRSRRASTTAASDIKVPETTEPSDN